jgi:lysophospholipase L1-like esterase
MKSRTTGPLPPFVSLALALLIALGVALPAQAAVVYPTSIAALGDSITRAFNTGWFPFVDAPANSWSTGTNSSVLSLATRLSIPSSRRYNYAVSGARMDTLDDQARRVPTTVQYVTILMGGNDVCTSTEAGMTSETAFETQFREALNALTSRAPNARIYVVSIPDVKKLHDLFKNNSTARSRWSSLNICQSMLANPLSEAAADVTRRNNVSARLQRFNQILESVCAQYARCVDDNQTIYGVSFVASDVTTRDYFHPSLAGQAKLALYAWDASEFTP